MSRFADRFTALIDACVLSGALRRNMLLSLAEVGMFRPRWSERILHETERAISRVTEGDVGAEQRVRIEAAFPESLVTNYEVFEAQLALPDPDDVHVLAAAIATSAAVIVTDNLRHFPDAALAPHNKYRCNFCGQLHREYN